MFRVEQHFVCRGELHVPSPIRVAAASPDPAAVGAAGGKLSRQNCSFIMTLTLIDRETALLA